MANFVATTASNGPRLKDPAEAQKVLDRYLWDGEVTAVISNDRDDKQPYLAVYGYDWPGAWKIPAGVDRNEFELDYDIGPYDGFEDFLREIAPFLAEPLTIQAVGAERCRFPLSAMEWHIRPGAGTIEETGFRHCDETDADLERSEPETEGND